MISVAQEGAVFRGKSSQRYVGMDDDGNLLTYVSLSSQLRIGVMLFNSATRCRKSL